MTISPDGAAQTSSSLDLTPANERLVLPVVSAEPISAKLSDMEMALLSLLQIRLDNPYSGTLTFNDNALRINNEEYFTRKVNHLMNAYDMIAWSINLKEGECRITWGKRSIPAGFNDLTPGAKRFLCKRLETMLGY